MAFLPDEQNLQTQNAQTGPKDGGAQAQQAPITSSAAPTAGGSANTINQASSAAPAQPFTNLQAYLSANAPQIQQQGQQIAGTLNSQYGATTGAIDAAKSNFGDQVKSGYTPNDQQVVNNFSADPTKVANDPNAAKSFTGMLNDSYKGPGSFESSDQYGGLNDMVQKGQAAAQQVSTPAGLQSYLMGQNPNETQGMATLDSSLLGSNPGAVTNVQNAAKQFDQLPSYLTGAVTQGNQSVQQAIAEANAAKAAAGTAFDTTSQNFNTQVRGTYDKAIHDATAFNSNYNDIIRKLSAINPDGVDNGIKSLSRDEQLALNVNNEALNRYAQANQILGGYNDVLNNTSPLEYGLTGKGISNADVVPLSSYLSGGRTTTLPGDINTVATPDQFKTAQALQSLGGQYYTSPLDAKMAPLAGTYHQNGQYQTFDTAKANGLFGEVTQRDQAIMDLSNSKFTAGSTAYGGGPYSYTVGDPKSELAAYEKQLADYTTSRDESLRPSGNAVDYTIPALTRLANGYGPVSTAVPTDYVPTPITPTLGSGITDSTPPADNQPGKFVAR